MKIYSDAALAAMESGEAIAAGAVAVYCDPPVFVWTGSGTIEIDDETYVGIDDSGLAQIAGGMIGGAEQAITLTLSGIDPDALALFDASELRQAPAKLTRLLFDGAGKTLLDTHVIKRGRIDDVSIEDVQGGTATVKLTIESAARGLGRSGKRMRSDADQRLIDPDDGFFKHVSYAGTKTIYFGGKPSSAAGTVTGAAAGRGAASRAAWNQVV